MGENCHNTTATTGHWDDLATHTHTPSRRRALSGLPSGAIIITPLRASDSDSTTNWTTTNLSLTTNRHRDTCRPMSNNQTTNVGNQSAPTLSTSISRENQWACTKQAIEPSTHHMLPSSQRPFLCSSQFVKTQWGTMTPQTRRMKSTTKTQLRSSIARRHHRWRTRSHTKMI